MVLIKKVNTNRQISLFGIQKYFFDEKIYFLYKY